MNQAYQVKLDTFEGPLDLLLHLINRLEIDIYDIPVAKITEQYMNYIHTMQHLELNIASEYLVMAATLLAIKSQMLLPKQEIDDDFEEYEEDPREELMNRLIEYRKFKDAAEELKEKELDHHQLFTRAPMVYDEQDIKPTVKQSHLSIYDLLEALGRMVERKQWHRPLDTKVQRAEIPIEERMEEILDIVTHAENGALFDELFSHRSRSHIVVTFIAVLELMKKKQIFCKQQQNFGEIFLYCASSNEG